LIPPSLDEGDESYSLMATAGNLFVRAN
jgi:hexosaminidase